LFFSSGELLYGRYSLIGRQAQTPDENARPVIAFFVGRVLYGRYSLIGHQTQMPDEQLRKPS
jgi:galactose mutarotase-like enzyme